MEEWPPRGCVSRSQKAFRWRFGEIGDGNQISTMEQAQEMGRCHFFSLWHGVDCYARQMMDNVSRKKGQRKEAGDRSGYGSLRKGTEYGVYTVYRYAGTPYFVPQL